MGILETAGRFLAGGGMGWNLPKVNIFGMTPQGIGAKLAGREQPFPSPGIDAPSKIWGSPGASPESFKQGSIPISPQPTSGGGQFQSQQTGDGGGGRSSGGGSTPFADIAQQGRGERDNYARSLGFAGWQELMSAQSVPSAQDAARQAAEEAARIQQEKMARFGKLITPLRGDIETYLRGRRPITELFQEEMGRQGITGKQEALGTLEREATKLGGQIETLPTEDIARRKETGMLSAAAERRIRAMEERPIREQLLKVTGAKESERIGLQRAYELLDKMLSMQREQEARDVQPLEYRLKGAEEQFGLEGEGFKSQIDSLAAQLSGFNKDRETKLKEYELRVDAGVKLTMAEQRQAAELQKLEVQHLNTMQEIAAKRKGQTTDFDKTPEIEAALSRIQQGATDADIINEFVRTGILDMSVAEKMFGKYNLGANKEGGGA